MNTSIITDNIPAISLPDVDSDAIVTWGRRILPFMGRQSFVRRHLVSIGLTAAVAGAVAFFVIRRKRADQPRVTEFSIDDSMQRVA